jgi:hypothetical protein
MNKKDKNKFFNEIKHFLFWFVVYSALYLLGNFFIKDIFDNSNFIKTNIIYLLLLGLFFSIFSRIIHSLKKGNRISIGMDVFVFWTICYSLGILISEYLISVFVRYLNFFFLNSLIVTSLFVGWGIYFFIKLVKRTDFEISLQRSRKPSQVYSGIILIIFGILTIRFSTIIFNNWFRWAEGVGWSVFIGVGLILIGFFMIVAWWRNNVSMFTTRHTVHWN